MITTVTLSPCIDKTVTVEGFDPEKVNRAKSVRLDPGGKGINVSLALAALGIKSRSVGLSFDGQDAIADALGRAGVESRWVKCPGQLRTNLKIFDTVSKKTVELNEQNPDASGREEEIVALCRNTARDSDILVLSGSIPPGMPKTVYRDIAKAAKEENGSIKVIIDAEGEALIRGLEASPSLIKPNVQELERSFGAALESDAKIEALAKKLISEYGVGTVLVSMGAEGAMAVTESETARAAALKIEPKSAQGAGDAMVAGVCAAISLGLPLRDILRYGTCAAAGAVEREGTGFCTRERFSELMNIF